jgi:hypothetical protein
VQPGQAAWASHDGKTPQSEGAVPEFLQRRRTRFESRAIAHGSKIREHIETRLRKRGSLKKGEHLEDAQARHQSWLQKREERMRHTEKSEGKAGDNRPEMREKMEERRAERRKRMEEMRARRKEQHHP